LDPDADGACSLIQCSNARAGNPNDTICVAPPLGFGFSSAAGLSFDGAFGGVTRRGGTIEAVGALSRTPIFMGALLGVLDVPVAGAAGAAGPGVAPEGDGINGAGVPCMFGTALGGTTNGGAALPGTAPSALSGCPGSGGSAPIGAPLGSNALAVCTTRGVNR
jgi:hypothetical protein